MLSTGFLLRLNIILDFWMLVFALLHFSFMILGVLFAMHMPKRTVNKVNVTGLFDPKRTVPHGVPNGFQKEPSPMDSIPLRVYAEGYHARTQIECYVFSIVMIISVLLAIEFIPWTNFICIAISTISALIIYTLSPVEDTNKPLGAAEVKVYGKKAKIILGLELGVLILLMSFGIESFAECLTVSLFVQSFMLVCGNIKNNLGRSKTCNVL